MRIVKILALAAASVVTANAGLEPTPRTYYKVSIKADVVLQSSEDKTKKIKFNTNRVIAALIDQLDADSPEPLPSTTTSEYDLIACYAGSNDQVMQSATYFLVRSRGQGTHFKTAIPSRVFDTDGGFAVFKRLFTANNSTAKVEVTDSFSTINLATQTMAFEASGLAEAKVTVKDVITRPEATVTALGPGSAYLSEVDNTFEGDHLVKIAELGSGVGLMEAEIKGKFKTETFDELAAIGWPEL